MRYRGPRLAIVVYGEGVALRSDFWGLWGEMDVDRDSVDVIEGTRQFLVRMG